MKKAFLTWLIAILISVSGYSQVTVTIGGETPTSTTQYVPMYTYFNNSYSQCLYLADEINKMGTINSLSYYLSSHSESSSGKVVSVKIYMALTDQTSLTYTNYLSADNFTLVYDGDFNFGSDTGWKTLNLTTPFELTDANLVIAVEAVMGSYFPSPYWGAYTTLEKSATAYNDASMPTTLSSGVDASPAIKLGITEATGPFCYSVKNLKSSNITSESATISWSEVEGTDGYQYELKLASEAWDSTNANLTNTDDTTIDLTGLTPNTTYNIRVRNVCSDGSYSSWKKVTFKTNCVYLTEDDLPYEMNPANEQAGLGNLPSCWTRLNLTHPDYPYIEVDGYLNVMYNNMVALNGYTGDITELQFSATVTPTGAYDSYGTLEVGIMTDLTNTSTYTSIKTFSATDWSDVSYKKVEVPFDTYTMSNDIETYYVVLKHTEPNEWGYAWNVKDITIEHIPDCKAVSNVEISAITSESATIAWNTNDDYTSWSVYYWKDNNTDTLSVTNLSDSTVTLTNLDAQTNYHFYIATDCGQYSPKTMKYDFETKCSPVEVTNANAFVMNTTSSNDLSCWDMGNWSYYYAGMYSYSPNATVVLPTLNIANLTTPYLKIKHLNADTELETYYRTSASNDWTELYTIEKVGDTVVDLIALPEANSTYDIKIVNKGGNYAEIYALEVYNEENPPACAKATKLAVTTTATAATFTWTQTDDASSWLLYYKESSDTTYNVTDELTETTYTLTVNPQTTYNVYVATACGQSESSYPKTAVLTFTTPCTGLMATDLPKTWDFDSNNVTNAYGEYPYPACWQRIGSESSIYVYGYSAYSGDSCLSINASEAGNYVVLPYVDESVVATTNQLQVSFYAKNESWYSVTLTVGVMTDPTDESTFTAVDSIVPTTAYQLYEFPLVTYQGQNGYVAIRATGLPYAYGKIDDVTLQKTPDCVKPQALAVSNITTSSATITWAQGGTVSTWNLYYKNEDDLAYTEVAGLTETSYNLTVLAGKTYSVYVAAMCSGTAKESDAITFTTPCLPLTLADLPYTMNFESETAYSLPTCWAGAPLYDNSGYSYPSVNEYYSSAFEGSKFLYFYYTSGVALKGYQGDVSALQLSFQARPSYNSSSYGTLEVGVQTDLSDESTYQLVKLYNASEWEENAYKKLIVNFDTIEADANTTYYIVIKHTEQYNGGYPWYLDDLKLDVKPACAEATNLTVTNITANTATVSWTQPDESESWTVYYKIVGEESYLSDQATDTTIELTNLTPQSNYTLYVQTNCTGAQPTTSPVYFRTGCSEDGITITETETYTNDFEDLDLSIPDCWTILNASPTYPSEVNTYGANSGYGCFVLKTSGDGNQPMAIMPKFTNDLSTLKVQFYTKSENSDYSGSLEFGYITDLTDTSTFVVLASYPKVDQEWTKRTVNLSAYATELGNTDNARLAFRHNNSAYTGTSWYYYGLDDVTVTLAPACLEAQNLTADPQTTSATITWTSDALTFDITVTDDENQVVKTEAAYAGTSYSLTNLTPNTTYTVSIVSNCTDGTKTDTATVSFTTPCGVTTVDDENAWEIDFTAPLECWTYTNWSYWAVSLGVLSHPYGYGAPDPDDAMTPVLDLTNLTSPALTLTYSVFDFQGSNVVNNLTVLYRANSTDEWTELKTYDTVAENVTDTIALPNKSATYQLNFRWSNFENDANGVEISALKVSNLDIDTTTPTTPCDKPTSLTASEITQTTATINWVGTASSYDVQVNDNDIDAVTTNSKQLTGLTANTTYTVKVRSNCGESTSDWVTTTFTTLEDVQPEPCDKPTDLNVTTTTTSLTLTWNGTAISYDVQLNDETIQTSSQTTYTFTGLTPKTTYTLKVRSNCGETTSDWATTTATTADSSSLIDINNLVSVVTYPNPTTTDATLEVKGLTEDANVVVMDVNGKVVYRTVYSANQSSIKISTENLSAGVYYIKVTNSSMTKTQTLIKQ
jgi:trimeric autotransporter adhesin